MNWKFLPNIHGDSVNFDITVREIEREHKTISEIELKCDKIAGTLTTVRQN